MTTIANGLNKQGLFVKHDGSPLGRKQKETGLFYDLSHHRHPNLINLREEASSLRTGVVKLKLSDLPLLFLSEAHRP